MTQMTNPQLMNTQRRIPVRESFDELTTRLQRDLRELVEAESALAKCELQLKVDELKREATKAAVAGGCMAIAAMLAAATAVLILNLWLVAWAAALVVTLVVGIGAISFARAIRPPTLVPAQTLGEVRRDYDAVREAS